MMRTNRKLRIESKKCQRRKKKPKIEDDTVKKDKKGFIRI